MSRSRSRLCDRAAEAHDDADDQREEPGQSAMRIVSRQALEQQIRHPAMLHLVVAGRYREGSPTSSSDT